MSAYDLREYERLFYWFRYVTLFVLLPFFMSFLLIQEQKEQTLCVCVCV